LSHDVLPLKNGVTGWVTLHAVLDVQDD
jgi:hypothetical protein